MANIRNYSTFVVQTNDTVNSIRYDILSEEIAPLAKQEDEILQIAGTPGLMFPGKTLIYDRVTGQLDVSSNYVKEYIGLIGYDSVEGHTPNMRGVGEDPGNFYVVADFTYKYMQNDWGTIGSDFNQQTRVYIGDIIEKEQGDSGDWKVLPMQIGKHHIHNDFTKYLHISSVTNDSIIGGDTPGGYSDDVVIQTTGY